MKVLFQTQKCAFLGGQSTNFFLLIFFCLCFKNNRHTNVILISIFENAQKKVLTPKTTKMAFVTINNFIVRFQKYRSKEHLCVYCFKAESQPKHTKNLLGGFNFKTKNSLFWGSKIVQVLFKSQISNLYFCVCSLT